MKLKNAIIAIQLQKRIARLRTDDSDSDDLGEAATNVPSIKTDASSSSTAATSTSSKSSATSKFPFGGSSMFRAVVEAKVQEEKNRKETLATDDELKEEHRRKSFNSNN